MKHDIILCLFLSFQVRLNASCIKKNKGKNCDKLCESQEIIHFRIQNVVFPAAEIAAMEELHSPEKALGKNFTFIYEFSRSGFNFVDHENCIAGKNHGKIVSLLKKGKI